MRRKRFFEWIIGEFRGDVEVLSYISEEDGEYFYNFESGECCNMEFIAPMTKKAKDLVGKCMVEVQDPKKLWKFETVKSKTHRNDVTGEVDEIPPIEDITGGNGTKDNLNVDSVVGSVRFIAPSEQFRSFGLPEIDEYLKCDDKSDMSEDVAVHQSEEPKPKKNENVNEDAIPDSAPMSASGSVSIKVIESPKSISYEKGPVELIVDKSKKIKTTVSMDLEMDVPAKSVYETVSENFDNGADIFVDYVVSLISVDKIKSALKEALLESYSSEE